VIVYFSRTKMQNACSSEKAMRAEWGDHIAKKLKHRLAELAAADSLADIPHHPPARCHELGGDRKGQLSVDLVHPYRLIFVPDNDPVPRREDGGLDRASVTRVLILEVADTH
jgi:proteic killer suppression protein